MNWPLVPLSEAGKWLSGGTPSTSNPQYWNGTTPWIGSGALTNFHISASDRNLTDLGLSAGTKVVDAGTLIVVVRGMSLKQEFRMGITQRKVAFGQDCKALVPDTSFDPLFLAYAVRSLTPEILASVDEAGHGTGRVQTDRLFALAVPKPTKEEQRAITEVLGALDDKIAGNTIASRVAQKLAESMYFQASGDAQRVPAEQVLTPVLGGTPDRSNGAFWSGTTPWVSAKDITAAPMGVILDTAESISAEAVSRTRAKPAPAGSVILTARGTVGAVARLAVEAAFNQSCYAFIPSSALPPACLFMMVCDTAAGALSVAHGSVFSTITMRSFNALTVPALGTTDRQALELRISPLLESITAKAVESRHLAKLRDTLLPHLMSGRITVRDAEKQVEGAL